MNMLRKQSGQGMTEYIIIVALIAIAAIIAFQFFGQTVRHQTAAISDGLAGEKDKGQTQIEHAGEAASGAEAEAEQEKTLKDYVKAAK